jgi:hypothetical protein
MQINVTVNGKGDSLWGKSSGEFVLNRMEDDYRDGKIASVAVFGPNTNWTQYTDTRIEKEVLQKLRPLLEEMFGHTIEELTWSEQGLQPDKGWNFDVTLGKKI